MTEIKQIACGLLMYTNNQVFLGHSGGPYYQNSDTWAIPKGLLQNPNENYFMAAKREFFEETGITPPRGILEYIYLGSVTYSHKCVHCWAFKGDGSEKFIKSNQCTIEYPKNSNNFIDIPELDKCEYMDLDIAKQKIIPSQIDFIYRLIEIFDRQNINSTYNIKHNDMVSVVNFSNEKWNNHHAHGRSADEIITHIIDGKLGEVAFAKLFGFESINFDGNNEDGGADFIKDNIKYDVKTINNKNKERIYIKSSLRADKYALMFYNKIENNVIFIGFLSKLDIEQRKLLHTDSDGNTYVEKQFFK